MSEKEEQPKAEQAQKNQNSDFFESKLFRLITLVIYLGGVGGLGFTLALYYLFIWESKMPVIPVIHKKH